MGVLLILLAAAIRPDYDIVGLDQPQQVVVQRIVQRPQVPVIPQTLTVAQAIAASTNAQQRGAKTSNQQVILKQKKK